MTEGHNSVHNIENYGMFEHAIIVKLAQKLYLSDATLQESEIVLLQTKADRLDNVVDDSHHEVGMVAVDGAEQNT